MMRSMMAMLENQTANLVSEQDKNMAHTLSNCNIKLNLSPEMRDITQTMWSTVPAAFENSDSTGNNFIGLFR